jgi:hypothetical protein
VAPLPDHAIVATATTDGFLSSVPVEHIDVRGRVATAFAKTRKAIDGDPTIWETKHVIGRALVTKTRGTITVEGIDGEGGEPVLARAGWLDTVKQAKRRGELTLGASTRLSAEEAAFAAVVYRACPTMPLERLVAADSDAAAVLGEARKNVGQWPPPYGDGSFLQCLAQASLHFEINDLHHSEI